MIGLGSDKNRCNEINTNVVCKSQAILLMGPGPIGTFGVVAVSRVAQDKRFAVANVHFLLVVMEDTVRVLQRIEKAATSRVVSVPQLRFSRKT